VTVLWRIVRLYSYAFSVVCVLAVLALSVLILISKPVTVNFYLLPWEGTALLCSMVGLALAGLAVVVLTWRGKMQNLFLGWSILVLLLIVRYYFFTPNSFTPDSGEFTFALVVILAAAIAAAGASLKPEMGGRGVKS
jgi:peptidoglycan/LPS O-acetylase OafA/YrhL